MADFTIEEICLATQGKVHGVRSIDGIKGISTDTRTVKAGALFIPLVGEKFDGHDFIDQAVRNGAAAILSSRLDLIVPPHVTLILVEDTLLALHGLARFHRQRFSIPVIGITGSNGKTTTKDMIGAVLGSRYQVLKTEANYNNEIGLPMTLLQLTAKHEVAVVEMGMRGKGQIRQLAEIALPTLAVITNVGETHIELLGSIQEIAAAKGELLEVLPVSGLAVLNADNPYVVEMAKKAEHRVTLFGLEQGDIRAENIQVDGTGMTFLCCSSYGDFSVSLPTVGKHNIYNGLAAIAVGFALGLEAKEIQKGIGSFNASPMRLHIEDMGGYIVINDAYNASPMSMAAGIDALFEVAQGRKVAVLGDMLELGEFGVEAHRQIGGKLAVGKIDILVTVGELAAHIVEAAKEQGVTLAVACKDHEEASNALQKMIVPGDTILIKGSRGMKMENMIKLFL